MFVPHLNMELDHNLDNIGIEELVNNQKAFNKFVYTPLPHALIELKQRWNNKELENTINEYLHKDIPGPLLNGFRAVLFRQVATPNYELRRFLGVAKTLSMKPIFLEYYEDKFTSQNPIKCSLGKMKFLEKLAGKSQLRTNSKNVIEFNISDGKKLNEVKTIWGESLIDFHHILLESVSPDISQYLFDFSDWFHRAGGRAKEYYSKYISLFVRNGVLFENFVLKGQELEFIKNIFLPAFIESWKITKKKPIIVPLLPLDSHDDAFWLSYPIETMNCIVK